MNDVKDYTLPSPSTVSGSDKVSKSPHEVSLGKFLRALAVPVSKGYVMLRNGQIVKEMR